MDNKQRLIAATRSWNALLFLLPQAARNLREVLRIARTSISDDAPAEEKALFAQQEAMLGEFYKAMYVMRNGGWEGAYERFQELIAECEEHRAKLDCEFEDPWMKELNGAVLVAAENPLINEAISKGLEGFNPTAGEDQNGERK
jgi:hypothetical protein